MKLINIIVLAFLMFGCDSKKEMVQPQIVTQIEQVQPQVVTTVAQNIQIVEEAQITTTQPMVSQTIQQHRAVKQTEIRTVTEDPVLPAGYKEETKLMPIKGNIPRSCQMWTDGCNTCTRAGKRNAECTTYKCQSNIKFSCLQWN